MSWTIETLRGPEKALSRLPSDRRKQIAAAIESMRERPLGGDVRKVAGWPNRDRRRVGTYRIIFDLDETQLTIVKVARRSEDTYRIVPWLFW